MAEAVAAGDIAPRMPAYIDGTVYREGHGYGLLARLRRGTVTADAVLDILDEAKLAGLGGAGFPTARKWRAVRGEPAPRLLAVNADEGEPGTFKDRFYLERDPHRFLEGILIAAEVVQAAAVYVYVRDEYPEIREILRRELANIPPGGPPVELRRGAGAYICGEESAMIESIEGKRGLPRHKPPLVFQHGLFGRPTLVNNVETLWWVRDIVERGAEWWAEQGRRGRTGLRSFSVSGRVRHPGVKLAPAGITARGTDRRVLRRHGGGARLSRLPAGRRLGRVPAGLARRPAARFRLPRAAWLLHRLGRRRGAVGRRRPQGRRAEPHAVLPPTRAAASAPHAGSAPKRPRR